jgi:hypothetical protein
MEKKLVSWNDPFFIGLCSLCLFVIICFLSGGIFIHKERFIESSFDNVCEDTENGSRMYREGVRSGNEDSPVYRDCKSYYDSFIKPQLSSSERGLIPESCFCIGYNSVPKSY